VQKEGDVMLTCCKRAAILSTIVYHALPIEWAETAKQQAEDAIVFQAGDKQTERLSDARAALHLHAQLSNCCYYSCVHQGELTGRCMPASLTADRIHDR
jgi:hypothetical protein